MTANARPHPNPAAAPRVAPGPAGKPSCMDAGEYARWQVLNRRSAAQRVASPCTDCTDAYCYDMAAAGRCELVVVCQAYSSHQLGHRRRGPGWVCPLCSPQLAEVPA